MRTCILIVNAVLVSGIVFFISCKKELKIIYQNPVEDSSHISITNASPGISSLQFFLNNKIISLADSPLSYGNTTFATYINNGNQINPDTAILPYINIPSGYQQLGFGSYDSHNIFTIFNSNFQSGGNYSVFITDTIKHGQITSVLLQDKIGASDSTKGQIRFLNLSPDAPPLDVWAYPNAGYNGYKIFSGCAYLPNDYNSLLSAQSFSLIDKGPYYFVATIAGTADIVLEGGLIIPGQSVVTIYAKGFVGGTGNNEIGVGVIEYKP
jgi:hypothetical protein